ACYAARNARQGALTQLRRRNLDRQWYMIHIRANILDRGNVFAAGLESVVGQPAAFDEKTNARRLPEVFLRTRIKGRDFVDGLALYPQYAAAGVDQKQFATGRAEFG